MVVVRKSQPVPVKEVKPVSKTARRISFFDYVRQDYGLDPINPDMKGMDDKQMGRAMREHREIIDEIRIEYYLEIAEGRLEEPDDYGDKAAIEARLRDMLPKEWTRNEGKGRRNLTLGMEIRPTPTDAVWVVDHVSPAGATIQLVSGAPDPHFTTARRTVISLSASVLYRRQSPATIRSMAAMGDRNKSRLTE